MVDFDAKEYFVSKLERIREEHSAMIIPAAEIP